MNANLVRKFLGENGFVRDAFTKADPQNAGAFAIFGGYTLATDLEGFRWSAPGLYNLDWLLGLRMVESVATSSGIAEVITPAWP